MGFNFLYASTYRARRTNWLATRSQLNAASITRALLRYGGAPRANALCYLPARLAPADISTAQRTTPPLLARCTTHLRYAPRRIAAGAATGSRAKACCRRAAVLPGLCYQPRERVVYLASGIISSLFFIHTIAYFPSLWGALSNQRCSGRRGRYSNQ